MAAPSLRAAPIESRAPDGHAGACPDRRAPSSLGAAGAAPIEAGYRLCFTTIPKTNRPPLDPFALGRYNVEPYGHYYFMRLLEGSCDLMRLSATRWGAVLKRALVHQMGAATD